MATLGRGAGRSPPAKSCRRVLVEVLRRGVRSILVDDADILSDVNKNNRNSHTKNPFAKDARSGVVR